MKIQTDFTPKPDDKVRRRGPSGQIRIFVFTICPDCLEGRWVDIYHFEKPGVDGCCKKCSIIRAKKRGWSNLK